MADPLSIIGSVVGIVSLGITVTQGLLDYYGGVRDQKSNTAHTVRKLTRLRDILGGLRRQLDERQSRADDCSLLARVESSMNDCIDLIQELESQLKKLTEAPSQGNGASLRAAGRRIAYPFRQSTLQKLDEDIDDFVSCLSLSMQLLQQNSISKIQDDMEHTKALLDLARGSQISSEIRSWLKAPDASVNFNAAAKKRHPGTGQWLIEGQAFNDWLKDPNSFLWISGFAGSGKSVLCSTITQATLQHSRAHHATAVAYFFFTFGDDSKQDCSAMLRALVLQLSGQLDSDNHTILARLHERYGSSTPPDSALIDCLHDLVREFQGTYIVLDALDESPRDRHRSNVLHALIELREWAEPSLHILVSSREEVDIIEELEVLPAEIIRMDNQSVNQDISSFVSQHLLHNRRLRKWADFHSRIEKALTTRAKGVFRWVECQLQSLENCPESEYLLEKVLDSLPPTLDHTYDRMLCNIPIMLREDAQRMLVLLCRARRPLKVTELIDGIAVQLDPPKYNPRRRLKDTRALQQLCPGFIEVDTDHRKVSIVRLAHFSIREYLESERIMQHEDVSIFQVRPADADTEVARICLTVLLEPRVPVTSDDTREQGNYDLALYAAQHWPDHFREGRQNSNVELDVLRLFTDVEGKLENWIGIWNVDEAYPRAYESIEWKFESVVAPSIYYASLLGLYSIVAILLDSSILSARLTAARDASQEATDQPPRWGADINEESGCYSSALTAASARGDEKLVQLLIDHGAQVNNNDSVGRGCAIRVAAGYGHEGVILLLLKHGAKVNNVNRYSYRTVLQAAVEHGNERIVRLLLDKGAIVDEKGGDFYGGPLQAACGRGHIGLVKLLIDRGCDISKGCGDDGSALYEAAVSGHENVVQLLINNGADTNTRGGSYGSAIGAAAARGYLRILKLLVENGASVEGSLRYSSPLQFASAEGRMDIVAFLIGQAADVNRLLEHNRTALYYAAEHGHGVIVKLLLDSGADTTGHSAHSALECAAARGHKEIVQRLLREGVDANAGE